MPDDSETTSVLRILGINESKIREIGHDLSVRRRISLKAKADITTTDVCKAGLKVVPDELPYRHALIIGWKIEKSDNIEIAKELSKQARLNLIIQQP